MILAPACYNHKSQSLLATHSNTEIHQMTVQNIYIPSAIGDEELCYKILAISGHWRAFDSIGYIAELE